MTEETTIPKKRGRKVGSKDTTKRKTKEQTEAQKAAHFKPGNKANADGWSMRKEIRAYRKKCDAILSSEQFVKATIDIAIHCAENGMFREFMEVQRFLAEYAYGKPGQMLETEEEVKIHSEGNAFSAPVIGLVSGSFDDNDEIDKQYL